MSACYSVLCLEAKLSFSYLLSPQTSPIGGFGLPSGRVVLFGSATPQTQPNFWKDPDPIIFSEIVEFALSLATPAKGQEVFPGLPHLQPYRLIRAAWLAELGHMDQANRCVSTIHFHICFAHRP